MAKRPLPGPPQPPSPESMAPLPVDVREYLWQLGGYLKDVEDRIDDYYGTPYGFIIGTNAALSVPANTETVLPFNTVTVELPGVVENGAVDPQYPLSGQFGVSLLHVSGTNNTNGILIFRVYQGGSLSFRTNSGVGLQDGESISLVGLASGIGPDGPFTFTLEHTANGAMIIDMTQSEFWLTQLTPTP